MTNAFPNSDLPVVRLAAAPDGSLVVTVPAGPRGRVCVVASRDGFHLKIGPGVALRFPPGAAGNVAHPLGGETGPAALGEADPEGTVVPFPDGGFLRIQTGDGFRVSGSGACCREPWDAGP